MAGDTKLGSNIFLVNSIETLLEAPICHKYTLAYANKLHEKGPKSKPSQSNVGSSTCQWNKQIWLGDRNNMLGTHRNLSKDRSSQIILLVQEWFYTCTHTLGMEGDTGLGNKRLLAAAQDKPLKWHQHSRWSTKKLFVMEMLHTKCKTRQSQAQRYPTAGFFSSGAGTTDF